MSTKFLVTKDQLAAAFTEWDRLLTKYPESFEDSPDETTSEGRATFLIDLLMSLSTDLRVEL